MTMSELEKFAELTQHGLFIVLVAVHAMQLIVLCCNLQQQPTCIKNIQNITCSGDPLEKYSIEFSIIQMRKRSFAIFGEWRPYIKPDQH